MFVKTKLSKTVILSQLPVLSLCIEKLREYVSIYLNYIILHLASHLQ